MILTVFLTNTCLPLSCAQAITSPLENMVSLSPAFHPPILTGVKVYTKDPFRFDFILDQGSTPKVEAVATRLIKYFLAALTIPEKDLWVNLSPYEKNRIVPEAFGQTEMGRDLLAQDYLLKQITASLMHPEVGLGKKFWDEIYKQAQAKFGTTDIPVDTFNKVWIVPARAKVYEKPRPAGNNRPEEAVAYVAESRLKVMLESDYVAMSQQKDMAESSAPAGGRAAQNAGVETQNFASLHHDATIQQGLAKQVIRNIILPVLEKEVNEGQNFAQLRQVYNSLILATWYKKKVMGAIKGSPLEFYVGQNKVAGVNSDDPKESEKIWARYVESFKRGGVQLYP